MTGPAYPPSPGPDSNAIGNFIIGVSTIGDIPSFDYWKTIISQYSNSPRIVALISDLFIYLDPTKAISDFFDFIFNVDTAQGYGLDVWGRIVGVKRTLQVVQGDYFGFAQGVPGVTTWGFGNFYNGAPLTSNYDLPDPSYRILILAKAAANITNGSVPAINAILRSLFPNRGNCYATDGEDMTMTYTFEFALSPVELAIVGQSGALPKSVGVALSVVVNP